MIGLTHLVQNVYVKVDDALCSAFVERFYPKTNTFHFSFGEMTITADNISNILGLHMAGIPVKGTGPHATAYEECVNLVTNGLGVSKEDAEQQVATKRNLSLIWLKEWKNIKDEDSEMDKECAIRA